MLNGHMAFLDAAGICLILVKRDPPINPVLEMGEWTRRRNEAFDIWSRSLQKMCECRNPADFVQTQQDWIRDAMRLAAFDIRAVAGDTTVLTRKMTAGFEKPVGSTDEGVPQTRRGRQEGGESQPLERVAAE